MSFQWRIDFGQQLKIPGKKLYQRCSLAMGGFFSERVANLITQG
jgi:hypothetical protein